MEANEVTLIDVAYPVADDLHLRIAVGACRLKIVPGESQAWITGTYQDPTGALPVEIIPVGGTVKLTQKYGIPEAWGRFTTPPTFDLALGTARPYALTLEGGATESTLDLGNLPLTRLAVKQGAARYSIDFSAPNPEPMSLLAVAAGAAGIEISHLANANFAKMSVEGGAAGYTLDFGGALQRDAHVRISTGVSAVEIRVPATTAAKIGAKTELGSIEVGDGFTKREAAFWTPAALEGNAPLLTIQATVALGSLRLVTM